MNKIFGVAAFAAAASAAALRREDMSQSCGFQIQSTGGVDAIMGQFEDGQNRLNGSYPTCTYYFSNGGIIDEKGRPCIVTTTNDATHQFQCDENSPGGPTLGFSIASNGSILFNDNDQFYACPYITEYNIYTQWLRGQDKCRPIKLSTNSSCAAGSSATGPVPTGYATGVPVYSAGKLAPPYPIPSATVQRSLPGTAVRPGYFKSSPVSPVGETPAIPGYGKLSSTVPVSSATTVPVVPGYGGETPSAPASSIKTSPTQSSNDNIPGYGAETTTPTASNPGHGGEISTAISSIETSPFKSSKASILGYGGETSVPALQTSAPGHSAAIKTTVETNTVIQPGHKPSVGSSAPIEGASTPIASIPAYSRPVEFSPIKSTGQSHGTPAVSTPVLCTPGQLGVVTVTKTVYASNCETTATEINSAKTLASVGTIHSVITASIPVSSAPGVPGYGISTPIGGSPVESTTSVHSVPTSAPASPAPSVPGHGVTTSVESSPVESTSTSVSKQSATSSGPGSSDGTPQASTPIESSPVQSTASVSGSAPAPSYPVKGSSTVANVQETTRTGKTTVPTTSVPASTAPLPSASASCAAAGSADSHGRYSCNPAHQYPAGQTCVIENGCYYLVTSSSTLPSAKSTVPTTSVLVSTTSTTCTDWINGSTTLATLSVPQANSALSSSSVTSGTIPAGHGSSSVITSATTFAPSNTQTPSSTTATACQTSLEGAYQTPHLITWISKDYPDKAYHSQYNASINEDCSTLFNFDIPADYDGKQCSVVFLFPKQEKLETSAWSWNEQGSIEFAQLSSAASAETTYNTCPAKANTLDTVAIEAGNSYVVSTGACEAGKTITIEANGVDGLGLEFFEDWNPSPLGLYITAC